MCDEIGRQKSVIIYKGCKEKGKTGCALSLLDTYIICIISLSETGRFVKSCQLLRSVNSSVMAVMGVSLWSTGCFFCFVVVVVFFCLCVFLAWVLLLPILAAMPSSRFEARRLAAWCLLQINMIFGKTDQCPSSERERPDSSLTTVSQGSYYSIFKSVECVLPQRR